MSEYGLHYEDVKVIILLYLLR